MVSRSFNSLPLECIATAQAEKTGCLLFAGMSQVSERDIYDAEKKFKRFEALINSMTTEERSNPDLLAKSPSRRRRIVRGSGSSDIDMDNLIGTFTSMRSAMRDMTRMMALRNQGQGNCIPFNMSKQAPAPHLLGTVLSFVAEMHAFQQNRSSGHQHIGQQADLLQLEAVLFADRFLQCSQDINHPSPAYIGSNISVCKGCGLGQKTTCMHCKQQYTHRLLGKFFFFVFWCRNSRNANNVK